MQGNDSGLCGETNEISVNIDDHALFEVTKRCNYYCKHCFTDGGRALPNEMNTQQILYAIRDLAKLGIREITFSGGDPALRQDIPQIVKEAKTYKVTAHLFSTLLSEEQLMIMKPFVDTIMTSLDGPKEINDNLRGYRGAYNDTVKLLASLQKYHFKSSVQFMATPESIDYIEEVIRICVAYEVLALRVSHVSPQGRGLNHREFMLPRSKLSKLFFLAKDLNEKYAGKLMIVTNLIEPHMLRMRPDHYKSITLHVLANGDVLPLLGVETIWKFGNLQENTIFEILEMAISDKKYSVLKNTIDKTYEQSIAQNSPYVTYEDDVITNLRHQAGTYNFLD